MLLSIDNYGVYGASKFDGNWKQIDNTKTKVS